ncbi:timeless protein-domain-containing protein [Naematelia encephala]|uniref:Timeless protein-domain-containing protein n=1 Tax=Naematelia encephala TaxID=71784 RepID=A0A1Y2BE51_9TREE|nr:timeless protein-domain-containing protein [Naematelia encephala]
MSSMIEDDLDMELPPSPGLLHDDSGFDRFDIFMPAVQSLVNALGGYEEVEVQPGRFQTIYRPGDSVLAVLKDLKKLWRKDDTDDERTVARCMARAGLMRELVALVVECTERGDWGRKVSLVACDLIAALTWPIDVAQELKEMQDEPDIVTDYASLLRSQVEYKAMILQTGAPLRCLLALMLPSLAKPRKEEKDNRVISLGLHIIRNLLAIKDAVADGHSAGEKEEFANLQSTLIIQLSKLTFFQLVLTLASCADKSDFNQFNVLVLDILHLVFRSVKAKELGQDQARAPLENLTKLLDVEQRQKALKSRVGMTRHSRFGTTVSVKAGDQKIILHKQNAVAANAGQILDDIKRKRAGKLKRVDELTLPVNLSPDAMRCLQELAKSFIQSCFNVFFASILKDIRMERSKIRPTDNIRTFYLARFFIEYLLILRQKEEAAKIAKQEQVINGDDARADLPLGLVAEMAELDSVRWVFMRMKYSMDDKPPSWTELQASLDCFTQILLLIDAMSTSEDDEDLEIAEILQNQLYYNGDILDSSLSVIAQYKDQSVAYLTSVVHFAYVFLRMLEKYSKNKAFMFVRKRKAARKKRKAIEALPETAALPEEYGNEEDVEPERDTPSYAEHAFTFTSFEKRFAQEGVVNTLVTFLARFKEFDEPDQMKWIVGLMHRQVIRTQAEGLYFKVSILNLFRKVLDSQPSLPKADSTRDLLQLISYVLRKFFKRVAEDPFLIVQAFGPKSRGHWKEISSYKSDEEDDDGMGGQRDRIQEKMAKGPPELEFKTKAGLSWSQQMEIAVGVLLRDGHEEWVQWIIEVLEVALAARTEVVLAVDGENALPRDDEESDDDERRVRNFGGPSKEAMEKFVQHDLEADTEDRSAAAARDQHFRLMLRLLSFDHSEAETTVEERWFIPASVLPSNLSTSLGALQQYLREPPSLDTDPKALLRPVRKPRQRRARSGSGSESDMDRPTRARKRKVAETQVFKSAAFIVDSDDDEEADRIFFEREKELRREMEEMAQSHGSVMDGKGKKKRKRSKGKDVIGHDDDVVVELLDEVGMTQFSIGQEENDVEGGADDESDQDVAWARKKSSPRGMSLSREGSDGTQSQRSLIGNGIQSGILSESDDD